MSDDNHYEDIIDKMMLDEVCGIDNVKRSKIEGLEPKFKRLAILSILDKDRKLFTVIKDLIKDNSVTKVDHVKKIIVMLRAYVKVGEVEKKKYGEVMTPLELVKEMVQTIPSEFWTNPNSKILDSCNGTGPFLIMVIYKLMLGLKDWEPDEEKRYKHILENMIYAGELQPKNMFLWLCAVDPQDNYHCNIFTGSFLSKEFDDHMRNVWGVEKFDLILGNPPYQEQKDGNTKSQPLWHLFVEKSMLILSEGGYLSMVHPSGWRNVDGIFKKTQNLLKKESDMIFLKMRNFKSGQDVFGAGIDYDFYCVKNTKNKSKLTKIICQDDSEIFYDIKNMEFIPSKNITEICSLIAKENEEKVEILYSRSNYGTDKINMSKEQTEEFKYPCVYTIGLKENIKFLYSNQDKGHFKMTKVIFGNGATGIIVDKNGDYGLTNFAYGIVDHIENLENIKKALNNQKFIEDIMGFKYSRGNKYNRKIIATFRKDFWKEFI